MKHMKQKKAFTLIELIVVLVILAIIALIVTPLVLRMVENAKNAANQRSVDGYGRAIELALANHSLDHATPPTSIDELDVKYNGAEVKCNVQKINDDMTIYLSRCTANGVIVKDKKSEDGYYHYGKIGMTLTDYVDMYGKAIDDALIKYQEKNGSLPNDISELTIDYSGKKISCDSTINSDATVYLTKCSVEGEKVLDVNTSDGYYHYGIKFYKRDYSIGDVVTYNNMKFYVIEDSFDINPTLKLLKAEPLTEEEVNTYGYGHVNNHISSPVASSLNGYGGVTYYSEGGCSNTTCTTTDYNQSSIKYVVDGWAKVKLKDSDLKEDENGYKYRLVTVEELQTLGCTTRAGACYSWLYSADYDWYWTMSAYDETSIWYMGPYGALDYKMASSTITLDNSYGAVRPVIILSKETLVSE